MINFKKKSFSFNIEASSPFPFTSYLLTELFVLGYLTPNSYLMSQEV